MLMGRNALPPSGKGISEGKERVIGTAAGELTYESEIIKYRLNGDWTLSVIRILVLNAICRGTPRLKDTEFC